jgi:YidC/Oxa1 family membrane protein insertase
MEKRAVLAVALSLVVYGLWMMLFGIPGAPRPDPSESEQAVADPGTATVPEPAGQGQSDERPDPDADTRQIPESTIPPDALPAITADARTIRVETPVYHIEIDNRGGVVTDWVLTDYVGDDGRPLQTVSPGAARLGRYPLSLRVEDPDLDERINNALYSVERGRMKSGDGTGERITLRYADGSGLEITKILEIGPGYLSRFRVRARGPEGPLPVEIQLGPGFGIPVEGKAKSRFYIRGQAVLLSGTSLTKIPDTKVDAGETRVEQGLYRWGGLEDTYFAAVLIADPGFLPQGRIRSHEFIDRGISRKYLSLGFPLSDSETDFSLFVGPKDLDILKTLGSDLNRLVDYRPRFIAPIARALLGALKFIQGGVNNWGWSIVILTIAIKVLFFPLTQRSSVSMRRMQQKMKKIQPRVQAIKDRYRSASKRKDRTWRQKMNQETMDLYQKEGVNPLGGMTGCLPLLLQMPILFGLFSLLSVAIELRQAPFIFWLQDLSLKDPYYVTPIVMGLTMFLQQMLSTPVGSDPVQRRMMMMMPIMFTFFFVKFPSGLVLYWLVSNLLGIGQQYLINLQAQRMDMKELGARHGKLQRVSR